MKTPLSITSLEFVCGAGYSRESCAASFRAGLRLKVQLPHFSYFDEEELVNYPIFGSTLSGYYDGSECCAFLVNEMTNIYSQTAKRLEQQGRQPDQIFAEAQIILVAPSVEQERFDELGNDFDLLDRFIRRLNAKKSNKITQDRCTLVEGGSEAFAHALHHAQELIENKKCARVLIFVADTYCDFASLEWLETVGVLDQKYLPGQAAGAVLIEADWIIRKEQTAPLLQIVSYAQGRESAHFFSEKKNVGEGLAKTVRELSSDNQFEYFFSDFTGEGWKAEERGMLRVRNHDLFSPDCVEFTPYESFGQIGSVTAIGQLCCYCHFLEQQVIPPKPALFTQSSWHGDISAMLCRPAIQI
ncbi:Beta-ketoacyl synthase [Chitinispirillum alkaliphilum]|nr:Beta-ketoacyl synthase [Chitinispirillum alkaliphilum]